MGAPACARPGHRLAVRAGVERLPSADTSLRSACCATSQEKKHFLLSAAPSDDAAARESAARQLRALGFPVPLVWRAERLLANRGAGGSCLLTCGPRFLRLDADSLS